MIIYKEKKEIDVYINKQYIGTIKCLGPDKYQYWPLGKKKYAGEIGTLSEIKRSIEAH